MTPSFWRGKRVFVTGHTGFKGSWLCLLLQSFGADVTGYALVAPDGPSLFNDADVVKGMRSVVGDVRDGDLLARTLIDAKPEIVLHLAAQSLVRYSYQSPYETYSTNVLGLVNLFEAVRRVDCVRAFVNVTSDKCYENHEWPWAYRENEAMGGHDPYSSSKGCAELITSAYRRSYFSADTHVNHGVGVASARAGNVIGGGDWAANRLVPDVLRALLSGEDIIVRNPGAIRPWQHVLEPLSGYLTLAERLVHYGHTYAEGWNFGPSDEDAQPVQWIVEYLVKAWGRGALWRTSDEEGPHEANFLRLDSSKARSRLGWKPRWNLEDALASIMDWAHAYQSNVGMVRVATLVQIEKFNKAGG